MKKLIVVACLALGAGILVACELGANGASGVVATAAAQDRGCSNIGTWATDPIPKLAESDPDYTPPWISTDFGLSASSGTIVTDVPHWPNVTVDPGTGVPLFPTAVRVTELKGVWERTGGKTFAFTQIGWGVDANGDVLYVVRNSGHTTLTDDCNTEIVESTMEWFSPADFMEQKDAFFASPLANMIGHRITVSPPNPPID